MKTKDWATLTFLLLALIGGALPCQTLVPKITVSPKTATIEVGARKQLSRTVTTVWSSSDTTIATVGQTGWVDGKRPGVVKISVTSGGTVIAVSTVTITPPSVAAITVTLDQNKLYVGQTTMAHATLWDARGNIIQTTSSIFKAARERYAFDWVAKPSYPWQR